MAANEMAIRDSDERQPTPCSDSHIHIAVLNLTLVDGPQRVAVVNAHDPPRRSRRLGLDSIGNEAGGLDLLFEGGRLGLLAAGSQPASMFSTTSGRAARMNAG